MWSKRQSGESSKEGGDGPKSPATVVRGIHRGCATHHQHGYQLRDGKKRT